MSEKDGGPASGKTLRDDFAASALTGMLANPARRQAMAERDATNLWAHDAYVFADAMLRAREAR